MSHRFQTVVRFQAVEPDRQISRIRLSDKTSRLHPRQAAPNRTGLHQLGLADAPGARPVVPHPRKTHRQRDGDGVRLCRGFLRLGLHSGLSSLSISALATAVAFSMACSQDPYEPNSGIRLVWGFRCQGWCTPFFRALFFILLFDPRREHSSAPTAYCRRRRAQRGSRTALLQRRRRLVLDQREHGGNLPVIGWFAAR